MVMRHRQLLQLIPSSEDRGALYHPPTPTEHPSQRAPVQKRGAWVGNHGLIAPMQTDGGGGGGVGGGDEL